VGCFAFGGLVCTISNTGVLEIATGRPIGIELHLPIPLPSWNFLLSANPWKRKKVRDLMHEIVLTAVNDGEFDECVIMEYMATIRPSKKNKQLLNAARNAKKRKR
jgi:hypothetical protein